MDNPGAVDKQSATDLPAITNKLYSAIPAEQRGEREQCLYIFRAGDSFIFEYKAFGADEGKEKKVLLWLMLRGGKLHKLTFHGMS